MFYFHLHLPHLPVWPCFTVHWCPSPVLEGRNPAGISVLPGRQRFHLGSHFPWSQLFLPGRTENLDGLRLLRTGSGHLCFSLYRKKPENKTIKHFMLLYTLLDVSTGFQISVPLLRGPGLLRHRRGFCRNWWMLLCRSYDGLDVDKEI